MNKAILFISIVYHLSCLLFVNILSPSLDSILCYYAFLISWPFNPVETTQHLRKEKSLSLTQLVNNEIKTILVEENKAWTGLS